MVRLLRGAPTEMTASAQKLNTTLNAIRKLGLPSRQYATLLARREDEANAAEKRHRELGRVLVAHVCERFRRALTHGKHARYSIEAQTRGYSIDWTRDRDRRDTVPVKPYIHLRLGMYGERRCEIDIDMWPTDAADLNDWCDRWIAWLRAAPLESKTA